MDGSGSPRRFPLGVGALRAMVLIPDGRTVVVGGDRRDLLVRDLRTGATHALHLPTSRGAVVTALAYDQERDAIVAGDSDGDLYRIKTWRRESSGNPWGDSLGGEVGALIAMPNGCLLAHSRGGMPVAFDVDGVECPSPIQGDAESMCYAADASVLFWHDGDHVWKQSVSTTGVYRLVGQLPTAEAMGQAILGCSTDGALVAAGGKLLVVWEDDYSGVEIVRRERMGMDCTGMLLHMATGLSEEIIEELEKRGAK